jgi:hypothetical protein
MGRLEVGVPVLNGHQVLVERLVVDAAGGSRRDPRQVRDRERMPVGGAEHLSLRREGLPAQIVAAAQAERHVDHDGSGVIGRDRAVERG